MPGELLIAGAGGSGREILSLAREIAAADRSHWRVLGFLDSGTPDLERLRRIDARVIGAIDDQSLLASLQGYLFMVAIGDGAVRRRVSQHLRDSGLVEESLVHPEARIGTDVVIDNGCVVYPDTALTTNVRLGYGVHVNIGCTLSHDVRVDDYATLSPGVHLAGAVEVGAGADIGTGAVAIPGVRIGAGSTVGAGAVVIRDVSPGTTVVGVPARPTSNRKLPS